MATNEETISARPLNRVYVRQELRRAESVLKSVWSTLAKSARTAQEVSSEEVMQIQPQLGICLGRLSSLYLRISHEQRSLVAQKNTLDQKYFRTNARALGRYKAAVESCVRILRKIGDHYAWFWYQNDRELLVKHSRHPATANYLTFIGGGGEISLICATQFLDGYFLIYHGITTLLRIGDLSLYDFETRRIHSLAEIKTEGVVNDKAKVTIIGYRRPVVAPEASGVVQKQMPKPLIIDDMREQARVTRQLDWLKEAFRHGMPDGRLSAQGRMQLHSLNKLALEFKQRRKTVWHRSSEGLILMIIPRKPSFGLAERLLDGKKLVPTDLELPPESVGRSLLGSGSDDLRLAFVDFDGDAIWASGLWLGFDPDLIWQSVIGDAFVCSLFNPGRFLDRLRKAGFEIDESDPQHYGIRYVGVGFEMVATDIRRVLYSIESRLLREVSVVEILLRTVEEIAGGRLPRFDVLDINLRQFLRGMSEQRGSGE